MARFDTSFDATSVEPTTAYELLPAGKYRAQIVESEMRVTRNGMGQFLWLMLDILEGEQKGRKIFDQLNLVNPNPTTVEIAQRTLSAICHAGADDNPGRGEAAQGRLFGEKHHPLPRPGKGAGGTCLSGSARGLAASGRSGCCPLEP